MGWIAFSGGRCSGSLDRSGHALVNVQMWGESEYRRSEVLFPCSLVLGLVQIRGICRGWDKWMGL